MTRSSIRRFGLLSCIVGLAVTLASAQQARAVIVSSTTGNTTVGSYPIPELNNVGRVGSGTGVYLGEENGNHWVITAAHIGIGSLVLPSGTFTAIGGSDIQLENPGGSGLTQFTDLVIFRINGDPGLPTLDIPFAPPTGLHITMMGRGRNQEDSEPDGVLDIFDYDATFQDVTPDPGSEFHGHQDMDGFSQPLRWGQNLADVTLAGGSFESSQQGGIDVIAFASDFDAPGVMAVPNESQVTFGDSGGGVFTTATGELSGLIIAKGLSDDFDGQPGNLNLFGNFALFADLSAYRSQIPTASAVPEPNSIFTGLLGVAAVGLALGLHQWRRRAARAASKQA